MAQHAQPTILAADDSDYTKNTVTQALGSEYTILYGSNGQEVIDLVAKHDNIQCIIMGMNMPVLSGLEATKKLKANFTSYHIPIIIVTSHIEVENMVKSVEAGADDYMKKPVNKQELKARVTMNIRRAQRDQSSNPLTHLPGNRAINKTITQRLNQPLALLYADLDNFKAYNDKYGFNKGDTIIADTADILSIAVQKHGSDQDFVGHIGGDDFIIVSTPQHAQAVAQNICTTFDAHAGSFYNAQDRIAKCIKAKDRQGTLRTFPLVSISVAILTNTNKKLESLAQIAQLAAELKKYAKSKPDGETGSNLVTDRRKE